MYTSNSRTHVFSYTQAYKNNTYNIYIYITYNIIYNHRGRVVRYHIRVKAHNEGHGRVKEVKERGRENWDIDMRPYQWE